MERKDSLAKCVFVRLKFDNCKSAFSVPLTITLTCFNNFNKTDREKHKGMFT